jgi:hypothetical protein
MESGHEWQADFERRTGSRPADSSIGWGGGSIKYDQTECRTVESPLDGEPRPDAGTMTTAWSLPGPHQSPDQSYCEGSPCSAVSMAPAPQQPSNQTAWPVIQSSITQNTPTVGHPNGTSSLAGSSPDQSYHSKPNWSEAADVVRLLRGLGSRLPGVTATDPEPPSPSASGTLHIQVSQWQYGAHADGHYGTTAPASTGTSAQYPSSKDISPVQKLRAQEYDSATQHKVKGMVDDVLGMLQVAADEELESLSTTAAECRQAAHISARPDQALVESGSHSCSPPVERTSRGMSIDPNENASPETVPTLGASRARQFRSGVEKPGVSPTWPSHMLQRPHRLEEQALSSGQQLGSAAGARRQSSTARSRKPLVSRLRISDEQLQNYIDSVPLHRYTLLERDHSGSSMSPGAATAGEPTWSTWTTAAVTSGQDNSGTFQQSPNRSSMRPLPFGPNPRQALTPDPPGPMPSRGDPGKRVTSAATQFNELD